MPLGFGLSSQKLGSGLLRKTAASKRKQRSYPVDRIGGTGFVLDCSPGKGTESKLPAP
jgi:hypothetical protein